MKLGVNFKSKSALQSSFIFTILTFLKPAINIFLLPIYLTILSPEDYGIYTIVITITTLVAAVGGLKINAAIVPFYYDCKTIDEKEKLVDNVISFIIIFNIIFFIISLTLGEPLFKLIFSNNKINFFPYILLAIATGMFMPIIQSYSAFVKNEKEVFKYALIQLVFIISGVLLQIVFIYNFKLEGALWAKLLANILTVLVVLYFLRNVIRFRFDKALLLKCLKFSVPLIPFFFIFWIGRYADRFVLEHYMSLADIAVFGLLMTFAGLVSMASEALANSIQPFLFEAYGNLKSNILKINRLFLFYSLGLIIFSSFLILLVSNINYITPNKKYLEIIPYFYFAIIPTLINGIQYLFFNTFTYAKKSNRLAIISFFTVSIQIIVLFVLVQKHMIYGAIAASFIGNLVSLAWYSIESRKYLSINYQWKQILPVPILFILNIIVSIFLRSNTALSYNTIGIVFPIPIIGFIILFYRRDIISLIKRKNA